MEDSDPLSVVMETLDDVPRGMEDEIDDGKLDSIHHLLPSDPEEEDRAHQAGDDDQASGEGVQSAAIDDLDVFAYPTAAEDEDAPNHNYTFRNQERNDTITAHIDQDDTGDYDPDAERQRPKSRPKNVNRLSRARVADSDSEDETTNRPQPEPPKLLVVTKFPSSKGKKNFSKLCKSLEQARLHDHDDFTQGRKLRGRGTGAADSKDTKPSASKDVNAIGDANALIGHPSARGCWGCHNLGMDCTLLNDEHDWPCNECRQGGHDCVLIVPPVRKQACERCSKRRAICSYTFTADHSGPCFECKENGNPCVAAPNKDFTRTRIRYDRDWAENPYPEQKAPPPPKKIWTCILCAYDGRACSLSSQDLGDASPEKCTACEMQGKVCMPQLMSEAIEDKKKDQIPSENVNKRSAPVTKVKDEPRKKRQKTEGSDEQTPEASKKETISGHDKVPNKLDMKPTLLMNKRQQPATNRQISKAQSFQKHIPPGKGRATAATFKTITTKLSHPVHFFHKPTAANPCDFCTGDDLMNPTKLAILGTTARTIQVAVSPDGDKYTEARPSRGLRMCELCGFDRLSMLTCQAHDFHLLPSEADIVCGAPALPHHPNRSGESFPQDEAEAELALDALFNNRPRPQDRWCSLCPALAAVECRKSPDDIDAMELDNEDDAAAEECCGLQLCQDCYYEFATYSKGFKAFVAEMLAEGDTDERPMGFRADVELLAPGGLLEKAFVKRDKEAGKK